MPDVTAGIERDALCTVIVKWNNVRKENTNDDINERIYISATEVDSKYRMNNQIFCFINENTLVKIHYQNDKWNIKLVNLPKLNGILRKINNKQTKKQNKTNQKQKQTTSYSVICRCLPPDRTWHKVKSPKAN